MAAVAGDGFHLSAESAAAYLRLTGRLGAGEPCACAPLGGGVSNEVVLVESPRGRWVLKQALPKLRVASEWLADAGRSEVEARCLAVLGGLLPAGAVPELLFSDAERHIVAMTAGPPGMANLKDQMLAGRVDGAAAARAGVLLGALQAGSRKGGDLAAAFDDVEPFRQLRIAPYYEEVARRHPDLAGPVRARAAEALAARRCLVHGDYSPKNMLVGDGRTVLLDFEVAHWGCRAFDPAFFLNHLALKAVHLPACAPALGEAARGFWEAYLAGAGWDDAAALEAEVVGHLGCLLLARVDGKSPVEYLTDEGSRERVRAVARQVLGGRQATVDAVLAAAAGGG